MASKQFTGDLLSVLRKSKEITDLVSSFHAGVELDYDEEAVRLFPKLGVYAKKGKGEYRLENELFRSFPNLHEVYCDRETGGKVHVGNVEAASELIRENPKNITHVVDCRATFSNLHAAEENAKQTSKIKHFRFQIERHWAYCYDPATNTILDSRSTGTRTEVHKVTDNNAAVLAFFRKFFDWVDSALKQGGNVLIHCLAGAHRAGTAAIGYLMYRAEMDVRSAIIAAKMCRSIIEPIGSFANLLVRLDIALRKLEGGHKKNGNQRNV